MAFDYKPNPQHTTPGQPPKPSQHTIYVDDEGSEYNAVIMSVGDKFETSHGIYWAVGCLRLKPGVKFLRDHPGQMSNPVSPERDGWTYNQALGKVFYCPCPPPLPQHPCP